MINQFSDGVASFGRIADALFFAEFYDIAFGGAFGGVDHRAVMAPRAPIPNFVTFTFHGAHDRHLGFSITGNTKVQNVLCFTHEQNSLRLRLAFRSVEKRHDEKLAGRATSKSYGHLQFVLKIKQSMPRSQADFWGEMGGVL